MEEPFMPPFMIFNSLAIPLLSVAVIPLIIRDRKTGEWRGYRNKHILFNAALLFALQVNFMTSKFGLGAEAFLRAFAVTTTPFICAFFYVVWTQKEEFGKPFPLKSILRNPKLLYAENPKLSYTDDSDDSGDSGQD